MAEYWYSYIPSLGSELDPASYRCLANQSLPGNDPCVSGGIICAVLTVGIGLANSVPNSPFSTNIQNYINNALVSSVPQPTGAIKIYLFKRPA